MDVCTWLDPLLQCLWYNLWLWQVKKPPSQVFFFFCKSLTSLKIHSVCEPSCGQSERESFAFEQVFTSTCIISIIGWILDDYKNATMCLYTVMHLIKKETTQEWLIIMCLCKTIGRFNNQILTLTINEYNKLVMFY